MFFDSSADEQEQMEVVVIDVTRSNFKTIWPTMILAVQSSDFVAVDLELSGLGDRKLLSASSVDERYTALCKIAKTRSIISCGLSCFEQMKSNEDSNQRIHKVQTFNLFLLCDDEYTVESQSLQFLVKHGFDFNKQYSLGIPYHKGYQETLDKHASMRYLFMEIISAKVPLIIHNGFIDLVFMYQCFYAELPNSLQTFVADIDEMFTAGIYDTKYISEYHIREKLSVLEYLFRKCQHKNELEKSGGRISVGIQSKAFFGNPLDEEVVSCVLPGIKVTESCRDYLPQLCRHFQERGFCPTQNSCTQIHSVDLIIMSEDLTEQKRSKGRSRKRRRSANDFTSDQETRNGKVVKSDCSSLVNVPSESLVPDDTPENDKEARLRASFGELSLPRMSGHRAGFDAFMTGYCFAFYRTCLNKPNQMVVQDSRNKVYLTAKDMPLTIMKSHFVKTSTNHKRVMAALNR